MQTAYTRWVRARLRCCVPNCNRPAEPHHVRTKGALGKQVDEANCAPLCAHHHTGGDGVHYLGRRTWAQRHQVCLPAVAFEVYALWLNEGPDAVYLPSDLDF